MNKEVYAYALKTYGRSVWYWVGLVSEAVRIFLVAVFVTVVVSWIIADIAAGRTESAVGNVALFFFIFAGGSIIGTVGEYIGIVWGENDTYGRLTKEFHGLLTNKDMSFYRDNQTGYLVSLFRQHLDGVLELVRFWRSEGIGLLVMFVAPIVVMWIIDWRIGAIALSLGLVQAVYVIWASRKTNQYRERAHEIYRKLSGEVSDQITNIVAYKNLGSEERSQKHLSGLSNEEVAVFTARRKVALFFEIPRALLTAFGMAAMFYFIVQRSEYSVDSVGVMALVMTYMFQLSRNAGQLPGKVMAHDDIVTKIYPTLAYLNREHETIRDPENPVVIKRPLGKIVFKDVEFAYINKRSSVQVPVLRAFNLEINSGEQVGVVGLSGAGKSTLANLLLRFDDVTGGEILIDDIDIRSMKQSDLRRLIAFVPQEPLLFHDTVRKNIAYQAKSNNQSDIERAAKAAHAHEFVMSLPDGYDTVVGERGVKLSGGQKQRIVIARAILKKAPIMLFDEATSALDSESEAIIQKAMPEIIGKKTAVIIAHRLSTVMNLDRIIVIEQGVILEQGTHSELLEHDGRYAALWRKQSKESI